MKITVMGSGTSHGVPVIGCACPVCLSADTRDKRMRASLYIKGRGGEEIVIDTGPDFRIQALRAGISRLDAILITHAHADHIHGLDDIRPLSGERPVPVFTSGETIGEIEERFPYIFTETQQGGGKPRIRTNEVSGPFSIGGLYCTPVPLKHGVLDVLGWRIDEEKPGADSVSIAYLTDTNRIPPSSLPLIAAPDILIIGGLRVMPHTTHFNFEQAIITALEIGAKKAFLTHICHDLKHKEIQKYCRNFLRHRGIEKISKEIAIDPAYDGLELSLE
ncbi:MAG: MBL fold metallo-hydrolase [Treponema sp.]|jgi:phosphoribosyl 1,2-cyclic phosphate phosphodiesterase|nr:MBL fold metallo-hydrolase [Treponema sp.]